MSRRIPFLTLVVFMSLSDSAGLRAETLPGFRGSPWFEEQVREEWPADGIRVLANADGGVDPKKKTRLVIFATPNGNSIEQTLGCAKAEGADFRFDIQHVAAQVRKLREITPGENIVLAVTEAEVLSWPAWKRTRKDAPATIRKLVDTIRDWVPGKDVRVSLACHSGGGSFLFGYFDGGESIPDYVDRIVFLDANYSYSDADKHGDKLLGWLRGDQTRRLAVVAYDDRKIMLNGKPIIGPDGGTFRATDRMVARFSKDVKMTETTVGDFTNRTGIDGQITFNVHANPKNQILHTALVGEMNGLLHGLTIPNDKAEWGTLGGPRAYAKLVQPAPGIPTRPKDAVGGAEFFRSLEKLKPAERETAILREVSRGNIPDFLRGFRKVTIKSKDQSGREHTAVIEVMPDYLAVGSDEDFVRVPMTPMTAARIADAFGCSLPTRKIVDELWKASSVKLEPKPLTKDRGLSSTFLEHHQLIEKQREGNKLGEIVAGTKKDVVITNRLGEKANRVAIYGWHKTDGSPIQPLTIVHVNWYVDYSHGVRLVKRAVTVDGKPRDIRPALYSADLWPLLSDEGPITHPAY
ncbi:hypothetical protein [Zavarzinella formosa]|uniref:hypothetical protein n=1 Tax=Zavarzinella formosa TaxID=360055 RepID=UPI0012F8DDA4|nr:hypothetical protein [Zavarzinella formosa]